MKISKYLWGSPIEDWSSQWKDRLLPSARSKVLQKWNASGKKPKPESSTKYTKRRVKEETKRTWRSDAADIAHGIGEGALALHPYTAIPYYGAKVGQDVLNGNVNWETALNASIPLFHLSPQAVGLREATNAALEDAANAGSKTARDWRVAREINLATKHGPHSIPVAHPTVYRTSAKNYYDWMKGENPITTLEDPNAAFIELRSHPEGHATVAKRHLTDSNGKDITFTFDKGLNRDNLLLLEFDDSHGPSILTLNRLLIEDAVNKGGWKGSQLAEEVKSGNTRESITFKNITSDQASQVIDFLDSNPGKDVYVHCLRGSSRSGAVDKFLEDFYGYTRPEGKSVSGASPEVYNALVEAYRKKHPNPKQIWVDSYYPVKLDESGLTSLKFFERKPSKISEAERAGIPKGERTTPEITAENAASITRTVQNNGKIRLSLPSHTDAKPRQFVLEPAPTGDNKYYVHMRMWDNVENKIPASNVTNEEKQQLFDALYDELPEGAEILFPKSGPGNYGTRGTVAGLQRLSRDSRFTPGTKGTLQYLDKDGKTIKTYEGTSFIKTPKLQSLKQGGKMNTLWFLKNGSGIHIKKKNRGKFTSYCGGKVTDSCIRRAKASGNPTLVKRATFAANARKWKHLDGGTLDTNAKRINSTHSQIRIPNGTMKTIPSEIPLAPDGDSWILGLSGGAKGAGIMLELWNYFKWKQVNKPKMVGPFNLTKPVSYSKVSNYPKPLYIKIADMIAPF